MIDYIDIKIEIIKSEIEENDNYIDEKIQKIENNLRKILIFKKKIENILIPTIYKNSNDNKFKHVNSDNNVLVLS